MEEGKYKTLTEFQEGSGITPEEVKAGLHLAQITGVRFIVSQYPDRITGKPKDDLFIMLRAQWKDDTRRKRNGYVRVPQQNANEIAAAYTVEFSAWTGKILELHLKTFRGKDYVRVKPRPDATIKKKEAAPAPEAEKPVEAQL